MKLPWWEIVARHATQYVKLESIEYKDNNNQIIERAVVLDVGKHDMSYDTGKGQIVVYVTPFQAVFWRG